MSKKLNLSLDGKIERNIRDWFRDHKATFTKTESGERLYWGKGDRGDWVYRIIYDILDERYLVVRGDLGCAVYWWSGRIGWAFLADCNYGYFAEKCEASENGKGHREWDSEYAEEWWQDAKKELSPEKIALAKDLDVEGALCNEREWHDFLVSNGQNIFGDDWIEVGNFGDRVSVRCRAHLIGIQMAVAQQKEKSA